MKRLFIITRTVGDDREHSARYTLLTLAYFNNNIQDDFQVTYHQSKWSLESFN